MCRILPTLADPICTDIFHTSAKDSRTSPRTGRQDQSARSCHDPAICPLADPISREEGNDPRTPQAPGAPHYIPGHPGSDLPARLMTVIDPRDTPELPCHRPPRDPRGHQVQAGPNDHAGHPILLDTEAIVRRQDQERCASITSMIRHYVARRAQVTEGHPHNADERVFYHRG
jgi:hypothetical protein